jgi:uncharacterized membrane-anchored protein
MNNVSGRMMLAVLSVAGAAFAAEAEPEAETAAPEYHWQPGPQALTLPHDVNLALPDGYASLSQPEAGQLLEKNGNFHNENLLGLVASATDADAPWFVTLRYEDEGYVKDDETPDPKELMEGFEEALPELNQERKKKGFPELTLGGWGDGAKSPVMTGPIIAWSGLCWWAAKVRHRSITTLEYWVAGASSA